jgi:hypothetical protein
VEVKLALSGADLGDVDRCKQRCRAERVRLGMVAFRA